MDSPNSLLDAPSAADRATRDADTALLVIDNFDHWAGAEDASVGSCQRCWCWDAAWDRPEPVA